MEFVIRYYSSNSSNSKNLTKAEAIALSNAGLYLIAVFQDTNRSASDFSYDKGKAAGKAAYDYAKNTIGQPTGTHIFFVVDYDASDTDLKGPILQYFTGAQDAIKAASSSTIDYYLGVYGGGTVCDYIYNNVTYVYRRWLSMSTGFRGSNGYTNWNIKQSVGGSICSIGYDADESDNSGMGWKVTS
ncbi:hypothetical protein D3C76_1311000 [compost metagenome]